MKFKSEQDVMNSMLKDGWQDYRNWSFDPVTHVYIEPSISSSVVEDVEEEQDLTLDQVIEKMKEEQK
jgi:hypothetical protein